MFIRIVLYECHILIERLMLFKGEIIKGHWKEMKKSLGMCDSLPTGEEGRGLLVMHIVQTPHYFCAQAGYTPPVGRELIASGCFEFYY